MYFSELEPTWHTSRLSSYPIELIDKCQSAILLCCGAFCGIQDVDFYKDKNKLCTLVDYDKEYIDKLKIKFKDEQNWKYIENDIYKQCDIYIENGEQFDIVSNDCWIPMIFHMFEQKNLFIKFYNISKKYLVLCSCDEFHKKHSIHSSTDYENFIKNIHDIDIKCINIIKRTIHRGGIFWIILEKIV